jgi:hypothetical protein
MSRETITGLECGALLACAADYVGTLARTHVCDAFNVDIDVTRERPQIFLTLGTPDKNAVGGGCIGTSVDEGIMWCDFTYAHTTWLRDPARTTTAGRALRALGGVVVASPLPILRAAGSELDNPDSERTRLGVEVQRTGTPDEEDALASFLAEYGATVKRPELPYLNNIAVEQREGPGIRNFYTINYDVYGS